jgi:potassium efflux system protein
MTAAVRQLFCACLLALATIAPALAQPSPIDAATQALTKAEADLDTVDRALDTRVDRQTRATLRATALAAQASANDAADPLRAQLALVDARIAGLGAPVAGVVEAADIRAERRALAQERSSLDSKVKRGQLIAVEAGQLVTEIDETQAAEIGQRVSIRTASLLTPRFWSDIVVALPRDLRRITAFVEREWAQVDAGLRRGFPSAALLGLLLAFAFLVPIRKLLRGVGQRYLIADAPGHRVRRSANALWRVLIGTVMPTAAAFLFVAGLRWSALLAPTWSPLADALVTASGFAGFTASVGAAFLMASQPSWRVVTLTDAAALALRPVPWGFAALTFVVILLGAFNDAVGASAAALLAMQVVEVILHLLLIGGTLLIIGRLRVREAADGASAAEAAASAGVGAMTLTLWLIAAGAALALLIGYVGFAITVVQFVIWATLLGVCTYLLMVVIDDVATSLFQRDSRIGQTLRHGAGVGASAIDQFGVLLSAVLRLAVIVVALGLMLYPFGTGFGSFFDRVSGLARGVELGGIAISPGTIVRFVAVLAFGLFLVRQFTGWLDTKYLPSTDLDGSVRNSIRLVARYIAIALAVVWALASLGIGMERIALLLSALSVGIGFGLQAITSNFVSGLILLAERPIKIGDLIRVGTDEGDVKRISVRSTEIELADHSTLIVPNSELITKSVLNKTLAGPLGRIQVQFSIPIESDADQVRGIVLETFAAEAAVLDTPEPKAFVDGIANGRTLFNCFAHVASPRAAYEARSNVLLVLLRRLRDEGVELGTVPQKLEFISPPPPAP